VLVLVLVLVLEMLPAACCLLPLPAAQQAVGLCSARGLLLLSAVLRPAIHCALRQPPPRAAAAGGWNTAAATATATNSAKVRHWM
jgi:hypothetical protein